jgi:uncharacterized protein
VSDRTPIDPADVEAIRSQLQRRPRGIDSIGHRCPCGNPDVVTTEPRLPDGTPFPTLYYVTCPRLSGAIGTLEASGLMAEMSVRLSEDPGLAHAYEQAHRSYLAERAELGQVPEIEGVSAGGMPHRVKCLHVLVGHALAAGPGVNPLGDETLELLGDWWSGSDCAAPAS